MYIIIDVMGKKAVVLLPKDRKILATMGENIKLARLRRDLSAELVAERASISRATLCNVEKGSPSVSIGTYVAVLHALGMAGEFEKIAADDILGRKLQDLNLVSHRKRASKTMSDEDD